MAQGGDQVALTFDSPVSGTFSEGDWALQDLVDSAAGDLSWSDAYLLEGEAGQSIRLSVSSEVPVYLLLVGPDGDVVGDAGASAEDTSPSLEHDLTASGTYIVVANSVNGDAGAYTLTLTETGTAAVAVAEEPIPEPTEAVPEEPSVPVEEPVIEEPTGEMIAETPSAPEATETEAPPPTDVRPTQPAPPGREMGPAPAIGLGRTVRDVFGIGDRTLQDLLPSHDGDSHWADAYSFEVTAGQAVELTAGADVAVYLALVAPDGTILGEDGVGGESAFVRIRWTASSDGILFAVVSTFHGDPGGYRLTLR